MLAMEGKCSNMSRVRIYLTHFLPELQKIKRRRSSLPQRQRAIRFAADMCLARTANKGSAWTRALNLRLMRKKKTITMMKKKKSSLITLGRKMKSASFHRKCCNNVDVETGGHDHGAIDRRLRTLEKIVPGGKKMEVHTLFQETADYILNLQMQVQGLEALADFYTANSAGRVVECAPLQDRSASCAAQVWYGIYASLLALYNFNYAVYIWRQRGCSWLLPRNVSHCMVWLYKADKFTICKGTAPCLTRLGVVSWFV